MDSKKLQNKLNRFESQLARGASPLAIVKKQPDRYRRLAKLVRGELISGPAGCYCLVRSFHPFGHKFGSATLKPNSCTKGIPLSAVQVEDSGEYLSPEKLIYIDTETTGLGGAGTVAFLVGCGFLVEGGFEIRQYLLPDYSDEAEMLEALLEEMKPDFSAVTYNGAAFDMPLIRDRMIVNRVARELPLKRNLDLLAPTRRLFKRRLQSCTLVNIERELFDFHRVGDVPGYLIPAIYFEWLNSEDAKLLMGVLDHNRLDILAMYYLLDKLVEISETDGAVLNNSDDVFSLSKLYQRRKDRTKVLKISSRLSEAGEAVSPDMLFFKSLVFKQAGQLPEAVKLWLELGQSDGKEAYLANLELAKYYEHKERDYQAAKGFALQAAELAPPGETRQKELSKRLNRLNRKLK